MKKKLLFYFVFLVLLTACNNSDDEYSSNNSLISEPEIKQMKTLNNNNGLAQIEIGNGKSKINSDLSNSNAKDITSLIPTGWHILDNRRPTKSEGDLNKDGILDIAIVIEKTQESEEPEPRSLLIAFGNNDNTYSLSIITDNVVPADPDIGGVWGDPFDGLIIDRGSVVLSDYGGDNWRWYNKYRFRYQDDDWYLIGATMGENYTGTQTSENGDEEDYNLLTGDFIIRKTDENGKVTIQKGNRGRKELIKLKDFNLEDM